MPKNGPETKAQPTSFWLDDETKGILEQLTQELNLNRSAVVREALRRMVQQDRNTDIRRLVAELERVVAGGGDG